MDVTPANEDTNSIPTDEANRTIVGNASGANFQLTSGATWWPNLQPMQEAPPYGQICKITQVSYSIPESVVLLVMFSKVMVPLLLSNHYKDKVEYSPK